MSKIVYKKYSVDSKSLSTLFLVLFWLVLGFIVCFIGIKNTYAATYYLNYQYKQQYYDNLGSSVNAISTTWNESLQSYVSGNITTVANSYGAGISISSPIPIISNHTYSISIYFDNISNVSVSSKSNIAISTSLDGAAHNYASNQFWANTIQSNVNNNRILQFVFTANGGGSFIFIPWTTTSRVTQSYVTTQIVMEDLGSEGISQNDINNSLNNQTNELNNSINNSTNTITGEINDMEQSIIDSNKETQDVIKDQFNSCRDSYNLFNANLIPSSTGIIVSNDGKTITMPLKTSGGGYTGTSKTLKELAPSLKVGDVVWLNFKRNLGYLHNNLIYLQEASSSWTNGSSRTITQNDLDSIVVLYANSYDSGETGQVILSDFIISYNNVPFEKYGEICSNKIDETNDKLDGIQGSLTDSSLPDTSGYGDVAGWLPAGTIDSLINLPLTLLTSINTNAKKSCSPYNLPFINNTTIQIPCIGDYLSNLSGWGSLINIIDLCVAGFFLYKLLMSLYKEIQKLFDLNNSDANLGGIE